MKVGILFICTGKYFIFWEQFYLSAQKFLLPKAEKHYFVFTDNKSIKSANNIHLFYESPKGFPLDSMLRFDMFIGKEEYLSKMDYLFFLNSNMRFEREINEEILPPSIVSSGLVAVLHPGYYNKHRYFYPYERRKKSKAYIHYCNNDIYHYFMGGLNGGRSKDYIELIRICGQNTRYDLEHNIIPIYHDESILNSYLHGKSIHILGPEYGFPEDWNLPFEPKIIILNKMKHGGKYFDKLPKKSYLQRFILKVRSVFNALIWKFQ